MKKITPLLALIATVALVYLSYASYTINTQMKTLAKENKALSTLVETRLKAMDIRLASIENNSGKGRSSRAMHTQNLELEREASIALGKIQNLISKNDIAQAKTDLAVFMEKYSSTRAAGRARRMNQELSVIGKDTPQTWGIKKWIQGKNDVDLNSKKDTILLIFWEEWCGYCRKELPQTQKLFAEYKDKGLKVVGLTKISRSATLEKVNAILKENNIQFPIAQDDGSISEYFDVKGIPASAVVSKGKIIWRGHPSQVPMDMIKKTL